MFVCLLLFVCALLSLTRVDSTQSQNDIYSYYPKLTHPNVVPHHFPIYDYYSYYPKQVDPIQQRTAQHKQSKLKYP